MAVTAWLIGRGWALGPYGGAVPLAREGTRPTSTTRAWLWAALLVGCCTAFGAAEAEAAACPAAAVRSEDCIAAPQASPLARETLLLQRGSVVALGHSGQLAPEKCRTAKKNEKCYNKVKWAMDVGIKQHPAWYPGLKESSSFEEFQDLFHKGGHGPTQDGPPNYGDCGPPCGLSPSPGPAPGSEPAPMPSPSAQCHTAVQSEECYTKVDWAMKKGIKESPEWYPGLDEDSSFEDFQELFHRGGHGPDGKGAPNYAGCRRPCRSSPSPKPVQPDPIPTPSPPPAKCHTATKGEDCYGAVMWAKSHGIKNNPEWYPGLDTDSSFEEFQALFHKGGHGPHKDGPPNYKGCKKPCKKAPPAPPKAGAPTRFLSWNVYYKGLASWDNPEKNRIRGIAEGIAAVAPEIASLQEMWGEKDQIKDWLVKKTAPHWAFATGGATETTWDGDILYRSDLWQHLESSVLDYGSRHPGWEDLNNRWGSRGLSWAALRRISDGLGVLVFGTHPWCCTSDRPVLEAVEMISAEMERRRKQYPGFTVILMGDMNADYNAPSQYLLRHGHARSHGKDWRTKLKFKDTYAVIHPSAPNPSTGYSGKIDYVYAHAGAGTVSSIEDAKIWHHLPGGSDHRGVSADIQLVKRAKAVSS